MDGCLKFSRKGSVENRNNYGCYDDDYDDDDDEKDASTLTVGKTRKNVLGNNTTQLTK